MIHRNLMRLACAILRGHRLEPIRTPLPGEASEMVCPGCGRSPTLWAVCVRCGKPVALVAP